MVEIRTLLQGFSASTSEGSLAYCSVMLLLGQRTTLVDVGYHARLNLLIERLAAQGLAPGDVDRIVLTHAHWDHCFNLASFPNAEVVIHRDELDYIQQPNPLDWATPPWTKAIFEHSRAITPVDDGDELEPGVRVMAVPGHSPGTMATLVETPDGVVGLVGDALTSVASASFVAPGRIFFDEAQGRASARKILDTCRFIYPGHDRAFRVEGGSFHYIEPQTLEVLFPPRDPDGTRYLTVSDAPAQTGPIIEASARRPA